MLARAITFYKSRIDSFSSVSNMALMTPAMTFLKSQQIIPKAIVMKGGEGKKGVSGAVRWG